MSEEMSRTESADLARLEADIRDGIGAFVRVGLALKQINERKLYRREFSTFVDYCRERWGFEQRQPYRLIDAALVVEQLKTCPIGHVLPATESQARELTRLADPRQRAEVWGKVVGRANGEVGNITAKLVREEVSQYLPAKAEPPFDFVAERDAFYRFLAGRVEKWPDHLQESFAEFVGGIVSDIQRQLDAH